MSASWSEYLPSLSSFEGSHFLDCSQPRRQDDVSYSPLDTNPSTTKAEGCFSAFKGLGQFLPHSFQEYSVGSITCGNGSTYKGDLRYGKPHGQGTLTYANGDVYEGNFDNDKKHGHGTYRYADGDVYEGNFKKGKFHGHGTFHGHADGDVYEGNFENGKFHGHGTYRYANGTVYEGNFDNGKRHGQGTLTYANGEVYEGSFENGKRHGRGTLTRANGTIYEGNFENDKFHGHGTYTYANGEVYEGSFENGKRHGRGTLTRANGNVYSGRFFEGMILSDKSNLGDLLFARLLFGYKATGLYNYSLGILSDYLKDKIDQNLANSLIVACSLCLTDSSLVSDFVSNTIHQKLQKGKSHLFGYGYRGHAMGLNLVPTQDGQFIDCEIFNSGDGLSKYHRKQWVDGKLKFETMLRVRVPAAELTPEKIKQFIEYDKFSTVEECYNAILSIPNAKIIPGTGVLQAPQKSGNCELEWIFAFLKNKMPLQEYKAMRLQLFVDCLRKIKENERNSSQPLEQFFPEKFVRKKLNKLLGRNRKLRTGPLFEEELHLMRFEKEELEHLARRYTPKSRVR